MNIWRVSCVTSHCCDHAACSWCLQFGELLCWCSLWGKTHCKKINKRKVKSFSFQQILMSVIIFVENSLFSYSVISKLIECGEKSRPSHDHRLIKSLHFASSKLYWLTLAVTSLLQLSNFFCHPSRYSFCLPFYFDTLISPCCKSFNFLFLLLFPIPWSPAPALMCLILPPLLCVYGLCFPFCLCQLVIFRIPAFSTFLVRFLCITRNINKNWRNTMKPHSRYFYFIKATNPRFWICDTCQN